MNLEYSAEQTALAETVRGFLADKAGADHARQYLDDPRGGTGPVWQGLAGLGATGLLVAPENGGTGATMVEAGIVAEALGSAVYPGPWLSCAAAARALARFGLEDRAAELLAGIAGGSTIATVGPLTGPGPVATGAGQEVLLRGEIDGLTDAGAADVVLVLSPESCGWDLYSTPAARLQLSAVPAIDLTRKAFRANFDDVPGQRLGTAGDEAVAALRDDVLALAAADALGAAQALLEMTIEYAKNRCQFGRPIGSFQAVQQLCVDMFQTVELGRGGVLRALWAADEADDTGRRMAAARIKAFGARLAGVGDTAIQVFGGIGYTWEHDAHLYLRRLLGFSGFLGSGEPYAEQVGAALVAGCRTERSGALG
ncbi:acyl-CoA dehydrogenase family protein [Mycobacterium sp. AMU20-3851]|uniref:acyl-CoA dehydrogenase family protein n=1 Tax=Mycobacterium sp. AMU20-3851 TaxID=3122055 RepID=UPI003754F2CF